MKQKRTGIIDSAIFYAMVSASWAVMEIAKRRSAPMQRAIAAFAAVYQFSTGNATLRIVFSAGRITLKRGGIESPDYEIIFLDPRGVAKQIAKNPNDALRLSVEHKIEQRGNSYYLFKYGYLLTLSRCHFEDRFAALVPSVLRKRLSSGV